MLNIGVLASHNGTNFQAILDACNSGLLAARVSVLISNNSRSGAMARAESAGIRTAHLSSKTHPGDDELDTAVAGVLQETDTELVVLAGYMKKLGPRVLTGWADRIINVHPSLLPRHGGHGFYGERVHQAILDAGDTETGATVHLVSGEYDTGPTLAQVRIPVNAGDDAASLASRLRPHEHALLIDVITQFAESRTFSENVTAP